MGDPEVHRMIESANVAWLKFKRKLMRANPKVFRKYFEDKACEVLLYNFYLHAFADGTLYYIDRIEELERKAGICPPRRKSP
jgi:hypothetical protein